MITEISLYPIAQEVKSLFKFDNKLLLKHINMRAVTTKNSIYTLAPGDKLYPNYDTKDLHTFLYYSATANALGRLDEVVLMCSDENGFEYHIEEEDFPLWSKKRN